MMITSSPPRSLRIRTATSTDAALLAELAARTFLETFGAENTPEDMALHLARTYGEAIQRRELADPSRTYLIAEVDAATAGYALVRAGSGPPCVTGKQPIEIERFYVEGSWHGRGVAQTLMAACESEARRRAGQTLWLGVWERNERARRFYEKMGFVDVGSQRFVVGNDPQTDRVLSRHVSKEGE
jgi:ribosomal protein S18 acetylase RimI-like enzyme